MSDRMETKDIIKKIRNDNGLTQQNFANKIGVSRQTVFSWEKGFNSPQTELILIICEVFNVDFNLFVNKKEEET